MRREHRTLQISWGVPTQRNGLRNSCNPSGDRLGVGSRSEPWRCAYCSSFPSNFQEPQCTHRKLAFAKSRGSVVVLSSSRNAQLPSTAPSQPRVVSVYYLDIYNAMVMCSPGRLLRWICNRRMLRYQTFASEDGVSAPYIVCIDRITIPIV